MLIIPAIDLKEGKCVRLLQGKVDMMTVYSDDPAAVARRWEKEGAQRIHVVDLDGAFSGSPANQDALQKIIDAVSVPVQFGGGVRDIDRISMLLAMGVWRVVLGTAAYQDKEMLKAACNEYPDRVAVGVDAKEGKTAIHGWVTETEEDALPFALRCQESGAAAIIYTDISRDGMLTGPNLDAVKEMAEALRIPLVASGGVSSLGDIRAVLGLEKYGVEGIIVGKALYTGAVSLVQAIDMTRGSRREC